MFGLTSFDPRDSFHTPEPAHRWAASSSGLAGLPNAFTYAGLAKSPRAVPGYDRTRRTESFGALSLKNTSTSSRGSWSQPKEYGSISIFRDGKRVMNSLSRGASISRAIVSGHAILIVPLGSERRASKNSSPSVSVRNARRQARRYSLPASVKI